MRIWSAKTTCPTKTTCLYSLFGILFVSVGYGAPNASNNKENLMKMLHYPESATKNVSTQ